MNEHTLRIGDNVIDKLSHRTAVIVRISKENGHPVYYCEFYKPSAPQYTVEPVLGQFLEPIKVGMQFIDLSYQARVEVIEVLRHEGECDYLCKGVGWDLPDWDNPTYCTIEDLLVITSEDEEKSNA